MDNVRKLLFIACLAVIPGHATAADERSSIGAGSVAEAQAHPDAVQSDAPGITPPKLKVSGGLRYPAEALRARQEGEALVRVLIDDTGKVRSTSVVRSSGSEDLDQAALTAVATWSFEPARLGDAAIFVWHEFPVAFRLSQ